MVTSYLQGGLGNQMFQITAAYNLAKEHNDKAEFNFNESHTPHQGNNVIKYKNTIFKEFNHNDKIKIENKFSQNGHKYEIIPYSKNLELIGFYQSEKFFLKSKKDITDKLLCGLHSEKDKVKMVSNFIENLRPHKLVSVHIRLGDYLKFTHVHPPCTLDYYNKALFLLKEKIGDFTPIFLSDDKQWCIKNFNGLVSPFTDEVEDMLLMSKCDHNIIANSSFSWWGAYLNTNPNKIVIGPKKWFGANGPQDQEDTIPKKWIKI
jgi:hypothetical protein